MNNRIKWYEIRRAIAVALIVTFLPFSSFAQAGVQMVHAEPMMEEPSVEISQNTMTVESEPADLQNPVLEIADDITLEEDWHITEEVVFTGGEIDLNGYTMTISANLIHSGGKVMFNGGNLVVDGDYRKQSRELQEDGTWQYGLSDGQLYMNNEDDYFLICGNYYNQGSLDAYDYLNMGCIELRGNYIHSEDAERGFRANSTHTFLISGEGQQVLNCSEKIENLIGSIKITNTSEEGVRIEGNHRVIGSFESKRESRIEGILCVTSDKAVDNGYYAGDVQFPYDRIFNQAFEFGGDVYTQEYFYLENDVIIQGNLYVNSGFYCRGDLTVIQDVYINGRESECGYMYIYDQTIVIKGDVIAKSETEASYFGIEITRKESYVLIEGDYTISYTGTSISYCNYGTLEVKGDLYLTRKIEFTDNATLILSGDEEQHVNVTEDSKFINVEIRNNSEGGVHFDSYINYEKIILSGNAYYQDIPMVSAHTLTKDTVIDGDAVLCGDVMSLNGHTLTVKGDLIQLGTQMQINGGELLVEGDYYIGEPEDMWKDEMTTYSNGSLYMTNVQDHVTVCGDLYIAKNCSDTSHRYHAMCKSILKAGTLDVKGDMVVRDGEYGNSAFETEENTPFTLVLSGNSKQKVWFDAKLSTTGINHLTITNTSDEGVEFIGNPFVQGMILTEKNNHITGTINIRSLSQLANGYYAGGIYAESFSTIKVNQNAEIGGDFINDGYLYMQDENSRLIVNGDFVNHSTHAYMETGTLELKGDFNDTSGITYDPAHRILFSDSERQTIATNATLGTIELQNPAGVYSARAFRYANLITNGYRLIIADEDGLIGYTLSDDETMIGDLYLTAGVMDLNGHTLTVKGDVILQEGTIDINHGTLIVEGDYRQQFRNRTEEGFTFTESEGLLDMSETDDVLEIQGDMILAPASNELVGMEKGTVILSGTEKQTITAENPFTVKTDLQIANTSLQGVILDAEITAEGAVSDLEYKTGGDGYLLLSDLHYLCEGRFGGNVKLIADCNLTQDFDIHGDLTLAKTLDVKEHKVTVGGNLYTIEKGKLVMGNTEAYVLVKGDVNYGTVSTGSGCKFTDGTLEVKGDYTDPNYTDINANHTLLLSGDSLQTVACNAYLGTLELNNHSEAGVYSENTIHKKKLLLNGCNLTIGDGTGIYGFTLDDDYVVEQNLTLLDDTLDLNGYTLTVKGDLILQEGLLKVNNGTLIVEGDLYTYASSRSKYGGNACGCLVMEHTGDLVKINGDWIMDHKTTCDCVLSDGIIELQGNIKNLGYSYSYHMGCMLILNGTQKQTIHHSGLQVEKLVIQNNSNEGVELQTDITVTEKVTDAKNKLSGKNIRIDDFTIVDGFKGNVTWAGEDELTLDVNFGGNLTIEGTLDVGHASLIVDGDMVIFGYGELVMDEADAYVLVKGDYIDKYTYTKNTFRNGVLEVKGNYSEQENAIYGNNHTLVLSGDGLQEVLATSSYGTIELKNYSEDGVYSEYTLDANQMITNGCRLTIGTVEGIYGKTLREDYTLAGDVILCGNTMDLNGHTMLVKGDLTLWDGEILINGGTLIVEGDLQTYATYGKAGHGCLIMEQEDDKVEIGGNWVIHPEGNCTCNLQAGTMELKGNLEKTYGYSAVYDIGCHLVMNGDGEQNLTVNSYTAIKDITFNNQSEEGIYVKNKTPIQGTIIHKKGNVYGNGIVVQDLSQIQNGSYAGKLILQGTSTLTQDITIDGTIQIDGELHCDGHLLEADNLIINGKLYTDTAYINVEENLTVGNQGLMIMNEADAYVLVKNSLIFNSTISHKGYLTDGTLEVMKNITVGKSSKGFVATDDHYTIFRRRNVVDQTTVKQDIYLNRYASIHFAKLELTKNFQAGYSDSYTTLAKWADQVIYVNKGVSIPTPVQTLTSQAITETTVTLTYTGDWESGSIRNYRIYRDGVRIATTTGTTYEDKGLEPNTTYTYQVYPCNRDYQMARSAPQHTVTTLADTQSPAAPEHLTVKMRTGSAVTMTWDKAGDNVAVAGYRLYRDDALVYEGKANTYKDEGLSANTLYTYQVKAYDTSGNESELSKEVDGAVYMPRIASITPEDYADVGGEVVTIRIHCKNGGNSQDATLNVAYYDKKNDRYVMLTKTPLAQPDTIYDYTLTYNWEIQEYALEGDVDLRFTLTDADGNHTEKIITYVIDKTPPAIPTNLQAQDDGGTVTINWEISKSADCAGYKLYRVNTATGKGAEIADVTGRNSSWYQDDTVEDETAYNYYIRAYDNFDNVSAMSEIAKVETGKDTKAPRVLYMEPSSGRINETATLTISGKDNRSVVKYELYIRQNSEEEWESLATIDANDDVATYAWDTTDYEEVDHYIKAVAVDGAGNKSEDLFMRRYEVDNTGIAKIRLLPATAGSTTIQLAWEDVTEEDFGYFVVEEKVNGVWAERAKITDKLGYRAENLQPESEHTYRVTGYDNLGNVGIPSDPISVTTAGDTTAPVIAGIEPISSYYKDTIPLAMTVKDNAGVDYGVFSYSVSENGLTGQNFVEIATVEGNHTTSEKLTHTWDISELSEGVVTVRFEAYDTAGIHNALYEEKQIENTYIIDRTAPDQVLGVVITDNEGAIGLQWNSVSANDVASYEIERATEGESVFRNIGKTTNTLYYTDTAVKDGETYIYRIRAIDIAGNQGAYSDEIYASVKPDEEAPVVTGISPSEAIVGSNATLKVLAMDNANLSEITIEYRNVDEVDIWHEIKTMEISGRSQYKEITWNTDGLSEETVYEVRAKATDASGNESEYVTRTYTLDLTAPKAPELSAQSGSFCIELQFSENTEEDFRCYKIYRKEYGEKDYTCVQATIQNEFTDAVPLTDTTYYYQVRAYDIYGNYSESNIVHSYANHVDKIAPVAELPETIFAFTGMEVGFDGTMCNDNVRINRYEWEFGDGEKTTGVRPSHVYEEAGTYNVTLTVRDAAGNEAVAYSIVQVMDRTNTGSATIRVNSSQGVALVGAYVYVKTGNKEEDVVRLRTDVNGEATFICEAGIYEYAAFTQGYMPADGTLRVSNYEKLETTIHLDEGEVVTGELTVERMELEEMIEKGVDLSAPENYNTYRFKTELWFASSPLPVTYDIMVSDDLIVRGNYNTNSALGSSKINNGGGTLNVQLVKPLEEEMEKELSQGYIPTITYLQTTQSVSWLKDMYNVELGIINNANSGYVITDASATLNLPEGLSLASTKSGQTLNTKLQDLDGQESATAAWIVKGDASGTYDLSASFHGVLQPFEADLDVQFEAQMECVVPGGNGLTIYISPEDAYYPGENYYIQFKIVNESNRNFYNLTTSLGEYQTSSPSQVVYIKDIETGELITTHSSRGTTYRSASAAKSPMLPVLYDGDIIDVGVFAPGQTIYGTYCIQMGEWTSDTTYFKLIDHLVTVLEGNNLDVKVEVKSIPSHISKYVVYTDYRKRMREAEEKEEEEEVYGDPIDITTGAFLQELSTIQLSGGSNLSLNLYYNSMLAVYKGEAGYGWSHDYEQSVTDAGSSLILKMSSYSETSFIHEDAMNHTVYGVLKENTIVLDDINEQEGTYYPASKTMEGWYMKKDAAGYYLYTKEGAVYTFDTNGQLSRIQKRNGSGTTITHTDGVMTLEDDITGDAITVNYNDEGFIQSVSDNLGRNVTLEYIDGELTAITGVTGGRSSYRYDGHHQMIGATNANGVNYVENTYDDNGRVVTQKEAGKAGTSRLSYTNTETGGVIIQICNQNGGIQTIETNEKGEKIKEAVSDGSTVEYIYDKYGNLLDEKDADGNTVMYQYDENQNLIAVYDTEGNVTFMGYDAAGNMTEVSTQSGQKSVFSYDENNRLIRDVSSLGAVTRYAYDENGNVIREVKDGLGSVSYTYEKGRRTSQTDVMGNVTSCTYDVYGNFASSTDAQGNITTYTYNAAGQLLQTVLPDGTVTTNTYDAIGQVIKETVTTKEGKSRSVSYTYDAAGNVTKVTDPAGRVTAYTYDSLSNVTEICYPGGSKETSTYDNLSNLLSHTDRNGIRTDYTYDLSHNVKSITTGGSVVKYEYYPNGKIYKLIDADGQTKTYYYDNCWNCIKIVDGEGNSISYTYDAESNVTAEIDPLGNKTTYQYDSHGRCTMVTDPNGNKTTYAYDAAGNVTRVTDALGNVTDLSYDNLNRLTGTKQYVGGETVTTAYTYDCMGRVTSVTNEEGETSYVTYDGFGNEKTITDAKGNVVTQNSYDKLGQLTQTKDALGNTTAYKYDTMGNIEQIIGCLNGEDEISQSMTYDNGGRLLSVTDPMGSAVSQTYDAKGNVASVTDANGGTTTYSYDSVNRVTKLVNAIGATETYTYNVVGLLSEIKDNAGEKTTYSYDAAGRLISQKDDLGTIKYTYDKNGNVLTVSDKDGTITRTYDALNRVTSVTDYNGDTISYAYDELGNRVSITYPGGEKIRYTYDKAGRMLTVTDAKGKVTYYSYDENGRLIETKRPDGSRELCTYNVIGQLTVLRDETAAGEVINEYSYEYDGNGNIINITGMDTGFSEGVQNSIAALTDDNPDDGITPAVQNADGTVTVAVSMTYDADNRLLTYNGQTVEYDKVGNMTRGPLNGAMADFTYDCRNRLIKVKEADGTTTEYEYDAENIRTAVISGGIKTVYTTDRESTYSQTLVKTEYEKNTWGQYKEKISETTYTYGLGLIGDRRDNNQEFYYHYNHIGSTMAVTDADGIIYYRYIYDTYGELSDITTDDGVSLKSFEQLTEYRLSELAHATGIDYLYNGQYGVETDQNGLYYMRARYYDQDIKRFINRDVVSGNISNSQSLNRYCYVQGNPVSQTDPFGLCPDGNSEDGVSKNSAIGWLLNCLDSSGSLYSTYANRVSPWLHTGLDVFGFFSDGTDAINGILYFLEGNTKLGIEYTLRGLTFYGALIGGPVGAGLILLGIGFNLGFAAQGMAGAIDRAYTDYQNGTLGWHNLADLGLNGLGVVGGVHVGTKSLRRAADMSVPRTLETPPATVGTGRGPRLNTYGDALREKLGPAYLSHPEEYNAILGKAKEMGVSIEFRPGTLAYDMEFGKAGKLIIDPDASIGALRHEYRHMLDDFSLGHPGMRIIADSDMFWKLEFRGYLEELNLARQLKDYDAGKFIIKEMRQRRMEILGR